MHRTQRHACTPAVTRRRQPRGRDNVVIILKCGISRGRMTASMPCMSIHAAMFVECARGGQHSPNATRFAEGRNVGRPMLNGCQISLNWTWHEQEEASTSLRGFSSFMEQLASSMGLRTAEDRQWLPVLPIELQMRAVWDRQSCRWQSPQPKSSKCLLRGNQLCLRQAPLLQLFRITG